MREFQAQCSVSIVGDKNIILIFLDHLKHKAEVHLSKPPEFMKRISAKTIRKDETESSNMEWTTSELKHTTPSKKNRLTNSEYKQQNNTCQPKKFKYH